MVFAELIGGIAILAGLYYMGIIISRCILMSARRMEVEIAEKEINIKKEQLKLLQGEVEELELLEGVEEDIEEEEKINRKEKLEVIIGEKFSPKNRW
jgi:flagellar motility protein MotE (MotC chaperone)